MLQIGRALVGLFLVVPLPVRGQCPLEHSKLLPPDLRYRLWFGSSIAVHADTMVIGATGGDENGFGSGAAYVFVRRGAEWEWQARLVAAPGWPQEGFGVSVSVYGDTAAIGVRAGTPDSPPGSAYVFVREDSVWTQRAHLKPRGGLPQDLFGWSVSLHEDTLVVGAMGDDDLGPSAGAAYVFARHGMQWEEEARLFAGGGGGFLFGRSVSTDGESIWVGEASASKAGSVYVFVPGGSGWVHQAKLVPSDGYVGDLFGFSVSGDGDRVAVGATRFIGDEPGAVHVFRRQGVDWAEEAKLVPVGAELGDHIGYAVALRDDRIAAGAPFSNSGGGAHLFVRQGTEWLERNELLAADRAWYDFFGGSIAITDDEVIVGAFRDDTSLVDTGSAYVFSLAGESRFYCTAKTNSIGCVPRMRTTGCASATANAGFVVTATDVRNQQPGLLFYGLSGRAALPYYGGILCLRPPLERTPGRSSRGHLPPIVDCSGALRLDMNAFAAGAAGGAPRPELLVPGTEVHCQWWARDPDDAFGVSLSAAVEYTIRP